MSRGYLQVCVIPEADARISVLELGKTRPGLTAIWIDDLMIQVHPETADVADRIAVAFTEAAANARAAKAATREVPA